MNQLQRLKNTPPWEWPPKAEKLVRSALSDRNATLEQRLLAASMSAAALALTPKIAGDLRQILVDAAEPVELRAQVASALGKALEVVELIGFEKEAPGELLMDKATFEALLALFGRVYHDPGTPDPLRCACLAASVPLTEDWHADAIRAAYATGAPDWRRAAVFGMQFVMGFDDEILAALNADDPLVQRYAVEAAGSAGLGAAWTTIVRFANNRDATKELRCAAIDASVAISPVEAEQLLEALLDDEDEAIAMAASDALEQVAEILDTRDEED